MPTIKPAMLTLLLLALSTAFAQMFLSMEDLQAMRVTETLVVTLSFDGGAQPYDLDAAPLQGACLYLEGLGETGEFEAGWEYDFLYGELYVDFGITTTGPMAGRFGMNLMDFSKEGRVYSDYIHRGGDRQDTAAPTVQDHGEAATIHFEGELDEGSAIAITVRCEGLRELDEGELEEMREHIARLKNL
jgi:hypothetical protein